METLSIVHVNSGEWINSLSTSPLCEMNSGAWINSLSTVHVGCDCARWITVWDEQWRVSTVHVACEQSTVHLAQSHATWTVDSELIHYPLFTLQNNGNEKMQLKKKKKKGKSKLPCVIFSPLMVVLLLSTVTQGGSCGSDEEGKRWCPFFFPRWPLLNLSFLFLFRLPTLLFVMKKLR